MLQKFYPGQREESAYTVDYETLWKRGFRGLIFDIDNTLVHHGAPADEDARALARRLKEIGFSVCLISNNQKERVRPFADALGVSYLENAHKPSRKGYMAALRRIGCGKKEAVFIGDQIFTDIYGANRAGIYSILVNPLHPKEEMQIVLKRKLEKVILYFYRRQEERQEK